MPSSFDAENPSGSLASNYAIIDPSAREFDDLLGHRTVRLAKLRFNHS
jgi:hypothetical protein